MKQNIIIFHHKTDPISLLDIDSYTVDAQGILYVTNRDRSLNAFKSWANFHYWRGPPL